MSKQKANIIENISKYKSLYSGDELSQIPITNGSLLAGYLKPVTIWYANEHPEYLSLLSEWRRENPIGFASIFDISDDRTKYWIENILLRREDRILFMIYGLGSKALGHIGLSSFNFEEPSCEIDNVIRGVKNESGGIMTFALKSVIKWCFDVLKVRKIYLKVLSDNLHAINYYHKNGFADQYEIPLYKVMLEDEIKWVEEKQFESQKPDRFYVYMKLKN